MKIKKSEVKKIIAANRKLLKYLKKTKREGKVVMMFLMFSTPFRKDDLYNELHK